LATLISSLTPLPLIVILLPVSIKGKEKVNKGGHRMNIFLAIVLAALLIVLKDDLAPIIFWAGWVGVILFLFNATVKRSRKRR
jgi:cell division protein FtsW (lipid II flippase)